MSNIEELSSRYNYKLLEHAPPNIRGDIDQILADIIYHKVKIDSYEELTRWLDMQDYHIDENIDSLKDIYLGAKLLIKHMNKGSNIIIAGDRDCDGITATYTIYYSLLNIFNYPRNKVRYIINRRKSENGISKYIVDTILGFKQDNLVDLVITVDHGSRDELAYQILKKHNIDILVTDHHTVVEDDYPTSADVFINPHRKDSTYPRTISGCQVALLLMLATYKSMYGKLDDDKFIKLVSISALSIISDVMPLNNLYNRNMLKLGINNISKYVDTFWRSIKSALLIPATVSVDDLSYKVAPLINTANRTHHEDLGMLAIGAEGLDTSMGYIVELDDLSNKRRAVTFTAQANVVKDIDITKYPYSIVTVIDTDYAVNGIIAARLGESYNLPSVCFLDEGDILNGSARAILPKLSLMAILDRIAKEDDTILLKYGGHASACGCSILKSNLDKFKALFDKYSKIEIDKLSIDKSIAIDAIVDSRDINLVLAYLIERAGPYGKDFDKPNLLSILTIDRIVLKNTYLGIYFTNGIRCDNYLDSVSWQYNNLQPKDMVVVVYNLSLVNKKGMILLDMSILDLHKI
jgi:single-stranded-DNA-specific exonuclease recJ|nr:MAG TPA: single-stranded-DNA-specific exonuclease RecJ [Caudoviricetes sp.]